MRERRTIQQLLALLVFFILVTQYPLLSIFNKPVLVAGLPLLYVALLSWWLLFILIISWLVRRRQKKEREA